MSGNKIKIGSITDEEIKSLSDERITDFFYSCISGDDVTADAVLLLGGGVDVMPYRAEAAAKPYLEGRAKFIVASGAPLREFRGEKMSEARVLKKCLEERGVKSEDIVLEERALTTIENLLFGAAEIGRRLGDLTDYSVIIATSAFHVKRALCLAKTYLPAFAKFYGAASKGSFELASTWQSDERTRAWMIGEIKLMREFVNKRQFPDMEI